MSAACTSSTASIPCVETTNIRHIDPEVFVQALEALLNDSKFHLPTLNGPSVLDTASKLYVWASKENSQGPLSDFISEMLRKMRKCFTYHKGELKKDAMWGMFHQMRTSYDFINQWRSFVKASSIGVNEPSPFVYQYVTEFIFKKVIKNDYPIPHTSDTSEAQWQLSSLTIIEQNALRYVAGYIFRKIRNQVDKEESEDKDDFVHALMELAGDELDEDEGTEEWISHTDRGGLWHVNNNLYSLFVSMEHEAKQAFKLTSTIPKENIKKKLKQKIHENGDVQFKWSLLSSEMESHVADVITGKIIDTYVTIRGFAFASDCIEMFKQHQKINLQKRKL